MSIRLSRALIFGLGLMMPTLATAQSQQAVGAIVLAGEEGYAAAYEAVSGSDAVTRDTLTWMRLREPDQPFDDYAPFLQARADWPRLGRIRAAGERVMPSGLPPAEVIAWFDGNAPQTGQGAVKLAAAMTALGDADGAEEMLKTLWLTEPLSQGSHDALVAAHSDLLSPLALERADAMLWRWRTDDARRLLPFLDADETALVEARIALIRKNGNAELKYRAVPAALAGTPGLLYDRYNWHADNGRRKDAITILLAQSTSAAALGEPFRWAGWRRTLGRWEMRNGDPARAYTIASDHFLTPDDGAAYTDLEWLSGYLALTYLDDTEGALAHFQTGLDAAETPITVSRMAYWKGRALESLDRPEDARAAYAVGAPHQTAFYGLLAAEKLGLSLDPALKGNDDANDWAGSSVLSDDAVRAGLTLMEAGRRSDAIPFFVDAASRLDATDLARLGAYLDAKNQSYYEVLLGKAAVSNGTLVPSIYFPIHEMAELDLPVDMALALAIARRESEFYTSAGSPVGAQGLMQLMPATAREVSGWLGLRYAKAKLTGDWEYNAYLGARYLQELQIQFGPSPVMVAAGYNAGPSRPARWMDERGDPRIGEADIVNWIEHIPFRETRNYVMRVTESLPVYRARLRGELGPIAFTQLLIGEKPRVRPNARPEMQAVVSTSEAAPVAGAAAIARPTGRVDIAPAPSLRPVPRPAD